VGKTEDLLGPQNVCTYGGPQISEVTSSLPRSVYGLEVAQDTCHSCGQEGELSDCAVCAGEEGSTYLCDGCYVDHQAERHFEDLLGEWRLDNGELVTGLEGDVQRKAVALLVIFSPYRSAEQLVSHVDRWRESELDSLRLDEDDRLAVISQRLKELAPRWVDSSISPGGVERWSATAELLSLYRMRYAVSR
jgi:hypothetical protein